MKFATDIYKNKQGLIFSCEPSDHLPVEESRQFKGNIIFLENQERYLKCVVCAGLDKQKISA